MKMGNCATSGGNSKGGLFLSLRDEEKQAQLQKELQKKNGKVQKKGAKDARVSPAAVSLPPPRPPRNDVATAPTVQAPAQSATSYDQEAIERMRHQLKNDPDAFLLNNLMLSVQFFDNYDKVLYDLKNNSITAADVHLNDNMAQHHKHAFLPDKLQEAVDCFVQLRREPWQEGDYERDTSQGSRRRPATSLSRRAKAPPAPLQMQRLFVVHDNVDVSEPDDGSNYDTVKGVPYYKMLIEESDEPGYVKLKKIEIIGNDQPSAPPAPDKRPTASGGISARLSDSDDDSDFEDDDAPSQSNEALTPSRIFMNDLEKSINRPPKSPFKTALPIRTPPTLNNGNGNFDSARRPSGILKNNNAANNNNYLPSAPSGGDSPEATRRPSGVNKNWNVAVQKGQLQQGQAKPKKATKRVSIESGYRSSTSPQTESSGNESDYGYATITNEATPKKLEMSRGGRLSDSTSIIPLNCMTAVRVRRTPGSEDDEEYSSRYGDFQRDLYLNIEYLNSALFMSNFKDLFLMRLYQPLGFTSDYVAEALTQGASIYCNTKVGQMTKSFEVIPAVYCNWPVNANEWLIRARRIIKNPRTNFNYQWPTQHMVIKARGLKCFIVPLGFRPTRGTNPQKELQWRLIFPTVERYLETCMAHSQVRCYMFTLAMLKFYVENEVASLGLNNTHIKNHMFWQLEDNYAKWPEDRLGEVFVRFLESLYEHIKKTNLPDYIIPQCNLLKGIPSSVLLKQQRLLRDILEFPVMHLLVCLKNFKYVKSDFYPVLDYKKLYRILTTNDILQMVNPNIPRDMGEDVDEEEIEKATKGKAFWDKAKTEENPEYRWKVEQYRQQQAKKAAETLMLNKTLLRNQFDRKRKIVDFDVNRRRLVLELFISHFIDMADCSVKFDSGKQAMIYLEQARRLAIVMQDEPAGLIKAGKHLAIINEKIDYVKLNVIKTGGPRVPKRNESFNTRQRTVSQSQVSKTSDYGNLDSPTIKFSGVIFADIHQEIEKPKVNRGISIQRYDEESDTESAEESRL